MPTTSAPSDLPSHAFPDAATFEAFLEREHSTAPGISLKFAKKASGIPSITGAEAVEVALCFGWIDGRANSIDDKWWSIRYTPRRAKSIWSQKNVGTVGRLIEEGKMRPAGLAAVEAAKADGRWDRAYAGPATMTAAPDFLEALAKEPAAEAYFESLNKSGKYSVLWPLTVISEKNRAAKIEATIQSLAMGKIPGAQKSGKHTDKTKATVGKKVTKMPVPAIKKTNRAGGESSTKSAKLGSKEAKITPRRAGLRQRT